MRAEELTGGEAAACCARRAAYRSFDMVGVIDRSRARIRDTYFVLNGTVIILGSRLGFVAKDICSTLGIGRYVEYS